MAGSLDTRTVRPFGINLAVGAVVMLTAAVVAGALFAETSAQLSLVALALAGCAALVDDTWASLASAGLGYLLFNGFMVNQYGELSWDGAASVWQVTVFVLATGLGLGVRWRRNAAARAAIDDELNRLLDTSNPNETESHGA